jgi:hypothetical protein
MGVCWTYPAVPLVSVLPKGFSMSYPASAKQIAFLTTLVAERIHSESVDFDALTSASASALISLLLNAPRKSGGSVQRVTELGMYRTAEGEIYKVQRSRESGNLYAKRLDIFDGGFIYEQGAISKVAPSDRMTLAEAKAFGVQYGICCVCGALLTDPVSVAEGIGPVCSGRV